MLQKRNPSIVRTSAWTPPMCRSRLTSVERAACMPVAYITYRPTEEVPEAEQHGPDEEPNVVPLCFAVGTSQGRVLFEVVDLPI